MAVTKTMTIVRILAGKDKTIFNDKLKDGARSIKVWGWDLADYDSAKSILKAAGLTAKVVLFNTFQCRTGQHIVQPRLHVYE
jgi:hypothetical protein